MYTEVTDSGPAELGVHAHLNSFLLELHMLASCCTNKEVPLLDHGVSDSTLPLES